MSSSALGRPFDGIPDAPSSHVGGVRRFEEVGDEFSLAIALTEASEIVEMYGDYDAAHAMLARGIELSERVGFSVKLLAMRVRLANVETLRGNTERAEQMHLDLLSEVADESVPWLRTMSYAGLSSIARRTHRPEQALSWIEQAWSVSRTREVPVTKALVLVGRGYTADLLGHYDQATTINARGGDRPGTLHAARCGELDGGDGRRARVAHTRPEPHAAAAPARCRRMLRRRSGGACRRAERFDVDRAERRGRRSLGSAFDMAFADGA